MKNYHFNKINLTIIFTMLSAICLLKPAFSTDRLIIKDSFGTDSFIVEDTGKTTAIWEGANTEGDGLMALLDLSASNTAVGWTSDTGFKLENARIGFEWVFRTFEPAEGFSATKLGTGGAELKIKNTTSNFQNVSLSLGNGATCNSSGQWLNASSRAYKENIQSITSDEALRTLEGLKPVKYNFKRDRSKDLNVGFIAEEVPDLVATKDKKTLSPIEIVAVLTRVVQEQQELILSQKKAFNKQKETIAKLTERISNLEER
jgi:hypothetical protein